MSKKNLAYWRGYATALADVRRRVEEEECNVGIPDIHEAAGDDNEACQCEQCRCTRDALADKQFEDEVTKAEEAFPMPEGTAKRVFETGASRDTDAGKFDFEAFLSPDVLEVFAGYMHKNRIMADGSMRAGDNWQKGMPLDAYMKSGTRHFHQWWSVHRAAMAPEATNSHRAKVAKLDALCGLLFNVQGYMFEMLKEEPLLAVDFGIGLI